MRRDRRQIEFFYGRLINPWIIVLPQTYERWMGEVCVLEMDFYFKYGRSWYE